MYTVNEIKEAINEDHEGDWYEFLYLVNDSDDQKAELPSLGVDAIGVDSGGEKYLWEIFKVGDQYFRMHGSHDSWEGSCWDGELEEVEPYTKSVVDYRSVKR
ncbi:hypothetical protein SEA_FAUST_207 [Streptomyces phage Faust]|uniref:Uncharacterized protein n=1 Tax=Streptomyces phage Faust TaxID=2767565 RepID=A0A7G9UZ24_9CAUD|nr:hypothetical protein PP456_gp080 [Streptomyces phage Faust]QNN99279.1 hypothetical protein SEA_FAUST_207 [Streptomyces phage Faust]